MKKTDFDKLLVSVEQASEILRGVRDPARIFDSDAPKPMHETAAACQSSQPDTSPIDVEPSERRIESLQPFDGTRRIKDSACYECTPEDTSFVVDGYLCNYHLREYHDALERRVTELERQHSQPIAGIDVGDYKSNHPDQPDFKIALLEQELVNLRGETQAQEITINNLVAARDRARDERDALEKQVYSLHGQYKALEELLTATRNERDNARQGRWPEVVDSLNAGIEQVNQLRKERDQLRTAMTNAMKTESWQRMTEILNAALQP